jgi:hypothetical protein
MPHQNHARPANHWLPHSKTKTEKKSTLGADPQGPATIGLHAPKQKPKNQHTLGARSQGPATIESNVLNQKHKPSSSANLKP